MTKNYKELLHHIRAFVFDMDGVLTNGVFQLGDGGQPIRHFNSKDSYALQLARKKGYIVAIICFLRHGMYNGTEWRDTCAMRLIAVAS